MAVRPREGPRRRPARRPARGAATVRRGAPARGGGRREEAAERERLASDPEALREHLRRWWGSEPRLGGLDEVVAGALAITLGGTEPLAEAERRALLAIGTMLGDPLRPLPPDEEPTGRQRRAFEELVEHHRDEQLGRIADLALRHGEGPALRQAQRQVAGGDLLSSSEVSWLDTKASDDARSRKEQERLASDYAVCRVGAARRLARDAGAPRPPRQPVGGLRGRGRPTLAAGLPRMPGDRLPRPRAGAERTQAPRRRLPLPLLREHDAGGVG